MPEETTGATGAIYKYPLTKMNFIVSVDGLEEGSMGIAAFNEVTGIDATVDVIEFRQGNSSSLAPVKIPGLVKHGNVTLKFGYTSSTTFKDWIKQCISEQRGSNIRKKVTIELIDITGETGAPKNFETNASGGDITWTLTNAWVTKYNAPDLNASTSEVAIESVEIAYEELIVAK